MRSVDAGSLITSQKLLSIGTADYSCVRYPPESGLQGQSHDQTPNRSNEKNHNAAERISAASPSPFNLDSIALLTSFFTGSNTTTRESRKDRQLHCAFWPLRFYDLRQLFTGTVSSSPLPLFPYNMSVRGKPIIPAPPRVISPSPTPSETQGDSQDAYLGPVTRSAARRQQSSNVIPPQPLHESIDEDSDPELRRARTRSRSPIKTRKVSGLTSTKSGRASKPKPKDNEEVKVKEEKASNGHLALPAPTSYGWDWRDFSRSPSPLGLIPIHRHFKIFIHKHEVPRKVLHVSIGFLVYWLYVSGTQTSAVTPFLMGALIPIATTDYLRQKNESLNRFYVRCLGALMRESEYKGWNGVVFYLLGAWIVLYFFPKDVAVVSVMLLSWCDTAASTFGRLYGRYTPRIRRGKSLAGSLAAFLVGVATAGWFWGWLAPRTGPFPGDEAHPFMFKGILRLPAFISNALGYSESESVIGGPVALGLLSLWSGLTAAGSEVIDLFGWDDNLTIPVLSGIGIWGFLKIFG
ncbi:uncharacterized protein F4822DRAFT_439190 [Hypoxylon trugodes]|uniref:uncharacterized protein n=1 Tax=Hypoxylon trugodes TaxID=326681 RepID=UPI00218E1420|nr:uncharacterized protein F4822DRAFT_439190 [Hypoxylon trugodes]KAI1382804.1 hypothetical protein F4822DRAFT_439190 [Hypoxylon trugodes]